ncbi:MAG: tRNA epoxyqueuosine(34) reductase QueG [Phycisphaerales bacterium]|jgi:epoxyqueuosine reductase
MSLSQDIKNKALESGFDLVGITDASPVNSEQAGLLSDWLNDGYAADMNYMHRNFEKRIDPTKLLENAKSVICVGLNYKPPKHKSTLPHSTELLGKVANYAQYEDYHPFIKKQLHKLIDFISSLVEVGHKFKICVDSAPLAERALAVQAGLGFIGKNHMLINPELGPQILLGEIITTLKLSTDKPITTECSNCKKCIDACPTGALEPNGQFNAGKCISYLTIEHKGRISPELAEKTGDRLFGCDECTLACPFQKNAPTCKNKQFKFYPERAKLDLDWILNLNQENFETKFADSPTKRTGLERLKRNARICNENIKKSSQYSC